MAFLEGGVVQPKRGDIGIPRCARIDVGRESQATEPLLLVLGQAVCNLVVIPLVGHEDMDP
jgi:hypothetical protein